MFTDCFIRPGEDGYIAPGPNPMASGCFGTPNDYGAPVCTRDLGHDGDHAAHGTNDIMLAHWPATTPTPAPGSA